jgi:hypothetical protein
VASRHSFGPDARYFLSQNAIPGKSAPTGSKLNQIRGSYCICQTYLAVTLTRVKPDESSYDNDFGFRGVHIGRTKSRPTCCFPKWDSPYVLSLRLKRGSIIKNYTYFTVCVVTTISLFFVTKVITVFVDYHKKLRLMISFFIKTSNENIILTGVTKNSKALNVYHTIVTTIFLNSPHTQFLWSIFQILREHIFL